jgi:hypothetical protein
MTFFQGFIAFIGVVFALGVLKTFWTMRQYSFPRDAGSDRGRSFPLDASGGGGGGGDCDSGGGDGGGGGD